MIFDTPREPSHPEAPIEATVYIPYNGSIPNPNGINPTIGLPIENALEFTHNREERCAIILVLDTSGSMEGTPIQSLNDAIQLFHQHITADPMVSAKIDIAIISFAHFIVWYEFVNATQFIPPPLTAQGGTIISFPLNVALDMVAKRKDTYRINGISHHRPWIVLITDGAPEHDTDHNIDATSARLRQAEDLRQCSLFTITCGDANREETVNLLRDRIASPNRPPKKTTEANFGELFNWLSNSLAAVSQSSPDGQVRLADTSGWEIV